MRRAARRWRALGEEFAERSFLQCGGKLAVFHAKLARRFKSLGRDSVSAPVDVCSGDAESGVGCAEAVGADRDDIAQSCDQGRGYANRISPWRLLPQPIQIACGRPGWGCLGTARPCRAPQSIVHHLPAEPLEGHHAVLELVESLFPIAASAKAPAAARRNLLTGKVPIAPGYTSRGFWALRWKEGTEALDSVLMGS